MAISNRDRVSRGMDILAVGLAQFVDERMTAVTPDGRDWAEMLQARDAAKHGREKQTDPTDPASPASIRVSANRTEVYCEPASE